MSLKIKIAERLKVKFPGVGLSKKSVEAVAEQISKAGLTEDSTDEEIDAKLDERNTLYSFEDQKKYDDYLAGKAAKEKADKEKAAAEAAKKAAEEGKTDPAPGDDTPAWAKALIDANKALQTEIAAIKGEKVTNTRKSQFEAILKDAPEAYKTKMLKAFDRMKFETDEDFNEFLTESETDVKDIIQASNNEGAGGYSPTPGNPRDFKKEASEKEVDAVVEGII